MLTAEILSLLTSLVQMLDFQQRYTADVLDDFNGMLKYEVRNERKFRKGRRACICSSHDVVDGVNDTASSNVAGGDTNNPIASTSGTVINAGTSNTDDERTVVFRGPEVDGMIRHMRAKLQTLEELKKKVTDVENYLDEVYVKASHSDEDTRSDEDTGSDEDVFLISEPPAKKKKEQTIAESCPGSTTSTARAPPTTTVETSFRTQGSS